MKESSFKTFHKTEAKDSSSKLIACNIKKLMSEDLITESELARQTGLPQTTVNRLLLGITIDPRANTLVPIAKFFGVTVGCLLGLESFSYRIPGTSNQNNPRSWIHLPIIRWEDILPWRFKKQNYTPSSHSQWITTENDVSDDSFALKTQSFMEPRFRKGSVIIVDPNFTMNDGNYIVVVIGSDPTVRKVTKDGGDVYLSRLYKSDELIRLKKTDSVIGTIVETRVNERC